MNDIQDLYKLNGVKPVNGPTEGIGVEALPVVYRVNWSEPAELNLNYLFYFYLSPFLVEGLG